MNNFIVNLSIGKQSPFTPNHSELRTGNALTDSVYQGKHIVICKRFDAGKSRATPVILPNRAF
jgi:hypothetical protein